MERRDALELLGLEPEAAVTHDQLRRAYLRRLRAHPPERDPEGFRRVREAFELLEPMARINDHMRAAVLEREWPGGQAHEVAAPAPGIQAEPPAPGAPDATSTPGSPDQPDPAEEPSGPDEHGEPDEPDAHGELDMSGEPQVQPPHRPIEPPAPKVPATLRDVTGEILALLEHGEPDAALELAERWKRSTLDDHREVSAHDAHRWALTRELLEVATGLPDSLQRAIAHGIATGNLASACPAAERYQARNPAGARDLGRFLAKRASSLHKVLGSRLQAHQEASPAQGSRSSLSIWVVMIVASALLRSLSTCQSHSSLPDYSKSSRELHWNEQRAWPSVDPDRRRWIEPDGTLRIAPMTDPMSGSNGLPDLRPETAPLRSP